MARPVGSEGSGSCTSQAIRYPVATIAAQVRPTFHLFTAGEGWGASLSSPFSMFCIVSAGTDMLHTRPDPGRAPAERAFAKVVQYLLYL
ncbi:hypothetical protein GCM10023319_75700 [Nocardia iowensis]